MSSFLTSLTSQTVQTSKTSHTSLTSLLNCSMLTTSCKGKARGKKKVTVATILSNLNLFKLVDEIEL
jgi:hypothetical protein